MGMSRGMRLFITICEVFSIIAVVTVAITFLLVFNLGSHELVTLATYIALALGTDVVAVGHIFIVNQSEDGRSPIWLVVFTYSKLFQSLAYTGVTIFVFAAVLEVPLPLDGRLAGGLVGCASAGAVLTATMFLSLWWSRLGFDYRVRPWPWQVIKDIIDGLKG
jgi:hypothetical protein